MRIISFSFSKGNVCYCICNNDKIEHWDLIEYKEDNYHDLTKKIIQKLNSIRTLYDNVDVVLIDKHKRKLDEVEVMIYTYFRILKMELEIKFINTKIKISLPEGIDIDIPDKYKMKGSLAVAYCDYYIIGTEWENYYNGFSKKDDIAQSYIQVLQFISQKNK